MTDRLDEPDPDLVRELAAHVLLGLANGDHDIAIGDAIDASPGEQDLTDDLRDLLFDAVTDRIDDAVVTVTWPDCDRVWELS